MFSRLFAILPVAALVAVAAAAPSIQARGDTCNGGSTSCCNQTFSNKQGFNRVGDGSLITAVVDAVLDVGLQCDTVGLLFLGGNGKCLTQTACCQDVEQDGLVNVACVPVGVQAL